MRFKNPGEGFRGAEGRIGYLLRQASHSFRLKIDRSLRKHEITHPQFAVLNVLELDPGLHASEIAIVCMLSRQAVKTIVQNLEAMKLVSFTNHKTDKRVMKIFLTTLGLQRLEKCRKIVHELEIKLLSGMTPQEEELIRNWLVQSALEQ